MHRPPPSARRAWLLYDARCGLCATVAPRWARRLGLGSLPQQLAAAARRLGLAAGAEPAELALLAADGRVHRGAEACRRALRRRWWALPLWLLLELPPSRWLAEAAYRWVARHRQRISTACRLRPPAEWRTRLDSNQ